MAKSDGIHHTNRQVLGVSSNFTTFLLLVLLNISCKNSPAILGDQVFLTFVLNS
jgi:hypothetical protein